MVGRLKFSPRILRTGNLFLATYSTWGNALRAKFVLAWLIDNSASGRPYIDS